MQIIIDTAVDAPEHVLKAADLLRRMFETVPAVIHPDDNPEKGRSPEPTITELTTALQARGLPPPPSLSLAPAVPPAPGTVQVAPAAVVPVAPSPAIDPAAVFGQPAQVGVDPAAVFGGAAAQIPPAPTAPAAAPQAPGPVAPVNAATPASAPSTAAATPSNGVDLDADGLPWDERIHAGSKTKTTKGVWTAKRGVNDGAFIAKVKAELRALMAIPAAPAAPPVQAQIPMPPAAPPAPIVTAAGAAVGLPVAPLPPGSPEAALAATVQAPPVPPSAAAVTLGAYAGPATFPDLITVLTPAMSQGRLTTEMLNEACNVVGVPSLPLLASRPDLIPQVFTYITVTKGLQP